MCRVSSRTFPHRMAGTGRKHGIHMLRLDAGRYRMDNESL